MEIPLGGGALDRADPLRRNPEKRAALWRDPASRVIGFCGGKPAIALGADGPRVALAPAAPAFAELDPDPIFLGLDQGAARFVVDLSSQPPEAAAALWPEPAKFIDLRSIGPDLAPAEAGMLAEARSLTEWRRTHPFCARCGQRTAQALGGWRRDCPSCEAHHFPRTDPVVIMLVIGRDPASGAERVVIGRQPNWPPGMHSLLAGYVEPGETIEAAVRRETKEECGVTVGAVRYLASQPWPFPSTLMIGCWAEALTEALTPDLDELEAVRWADKQEMRAALEHRHPEILSPRTDAIAWALIRAWVEDDLGL